MTEESFRPLTDKEQEIVARLLSVEFADRDVVKQQFSSAVGKVIDTEGSLELKTGDEHQARINGVPVEAIWVDGNGYPVGILLHIRDGFIHELEIVSYSGEPIEGEIVPDEIKLGRFGS